jgi:hypothetical protein
MDRSPTTRRQNVIGNVRVNRRQLILGTGAAALSLATRRVVAEDEPIVIIQTHQDHQAPAIPEHALVGTPDAIEFPANVSAGLNRITMVNDTGTSFHALTMRVPDRVSHEQLEADLANEGDPEWFFESYFASNPDQAPPGGELSAVVAYPAGRYVILNVFTGAMTRFVAHGDSWGRPAPTADRTVGLVDYGFLALDSVVAGRQRWQVTNHGATWHDITIFRGPAGGTPESFLEAAMSSEAFPPAGYEHVGGVGAMSPGVSVWVELDLVPGTYIGSCFLPGDDDMPHAMQGMVATFEVS